MKIKNSTLTFFTKTILLILLLVATKEVVAQGRWEYVGAIHGRWVNSVKYLDGNNNIFVGGFQQTNAIARNTSRGTFLDMYNDYDSIQYRFTDVSFPTHTIGYVAGWRGAILKTINHANSWVFLNRYLPSAVTTRDYNGLHFVNTSLGYVVGGHDNTQQTILKTTDGGYNWTIQRDIAGAWLTSVYFTSATTGVAVGEAGTILRTTNGGTTWNTVLVSGAAGTRDFSKVIFHNATTGFIVGGDSLANILTILKTTDGGLNWSVISDLANEQKLNGIAFKDANTGFAVGNKGIIKTTTDGGNNWTTFTLPENINDTIRNLHTVSFYNTYSGAFGGQDGKYFVYIDDAIPPTASAITDSSRLNLNNTVELFGSLNANNGITHATFEYGLTTGFENAVAVLPDSITGNTFQSVTITTPVLPDGIYNYRLRVSSPGGDSVGATKQFFVGVPTVTTGSVVIDATNKVQFSGFARGNGSNSTIQFEYGLTNAFGNTVNITTNPISSYTDQAVSAYSPVLADGIYFYRIKGASATGVVYGETKQFYVGTNPIPNFDFEYWITDTFNTLEDWISISCSQSTSYDGSKSVRVDGTQNVEGWGLALMGGLGNDGPSGGTPFTARPDSAVAYFKYDLSPSVPALFGVLLKKDGNIISFNPFQIGTSIDTTTNGEFMRMSFPISYPDSTILPDSIIVIILSSDIFISQVVDPNNVIEADNLSFIGTTQNVPNANFENWDQKTAEYPTFWNTNNKQNAFNPIQVSKTTDAQNGIFAMKMQNDVATNSPAFAEVDYPGDNRYGPAFPVSQKHKTINGYYKFQPENGDTALLKIDMYKNGLGIGNLFIIFTESDTVYKPFSDSINYFGSSEIPDSASIVISCINNYEGTINGNSILYIDNLSFDGNRTSDTLVITKINQNAITTKDLHLYPNPANNYVAIELPKNEKVLSVNIFDMKGTVVYTESIENSYNLKMFNTSDLPTGIFFIRIQTDEVIYTKKFVISR
jgi:photosystem II stability/assembly factor-like uncharacterized protein